MRTPTTSGGLGKIGAVLLALAFSGIAAAEPVAATTGEDPGAATFTKDIVPILQRSCQNCHQPDSVAPSL